MHTQINMADLSKQLGDFSTSISDVTRSYLGVDEASNKQDTGPIYIHA